jgi:nucleotide-binding universal stress UspA family protein
VLSNPSEERLMAKPIIVGYDPNSSDRSPVAFALRAARLTGAPLVIASVGSHPEAHEAHVEDDLSQAAGSALVELQRDLDAEGVAVENVELKNTSAARALHEAAEERDAGLIVVGSTNRGAVGRVLVGSTADRLMHGAPSPIAVVPHGWQAGAGLNTIGVAFVDTEEGREALRSAHALARRAGAKLRVITAVKPGVRSTYGELEPTRAVQPGKGETDVEGELRVRAERELRDATAALGDDVQVESDAFVEDPAEVLVTVSQNVDLLICGSRSYGPRRAVLLGGVSRRLAAESHCPVIVLPRGLESSLEALIAEAPDAATAG